MAQRYIEFLKQEDFNTAKNEGSIEINGETLSYSKENLYLVPDETQEQIADLQAEQAVQGVKIDTVQASIKKYYRHDISIPLTNGGNLHLSFPNSTGTAYTRFGQISSFTQSLARQVAYLNTNGYGSVALVLVSENTYLIQGAVCASDGVAVIAQEETFASDYAIIDTVTEL